MTADDHPRGDWARAPETLASTAANPANSGVLPKPTSVATHECRPGDEEQPLLPRTEQRSAGAVKIGSLISVLLLGEFIGSADSTLVIAAGPDIASEFHRLQDVAWLSTAYVLAVCVAQPLLGKLSDIFGRKSTLLVTYAFFGFGCIICVGNSMEVVILGRVVSGIGGGGMMTMSSIVIADIVPTRDIAAWRSYVNLSMTLGRSVGGPIGGLLTDTIGWRWLFLIQAPMVLAQALLVMLSFQLPKEEECSDSPSDPQKSKLRRVDFLGSGLLGSSIVTGMLLLELGGQSFSWTSLAAIGLGVASLGFGIFFVLTEAYVAAEPVFSLHLLTIPDVVLSYLVMLFQMIAQLALMAFVPLYFQVTAGATATEAGSHLVPAVVGNAVGGLLSGAIVKRTGRYKLLLTCSGLVSAAAYAMLIARWNGQTGFWESLYIFPGGFGSGMMSAATFLSMTVSIKPADIAMATSGLYLMMNLGMITAFTGASAILHYVFEQQVMKQLDGPGAAEVSFSRFRKLNRQIIKRSLSDVSFIEHLEGRTKAVVVSSYVTGLHCTYALSLVCALLAFTLSSFMKNRQL